MHELGRQLSLRSAGVLRWRLRWRWSSGRRETEEFGHERGPGSGVPLSLATCGRWCGWREAQEFGYQLTLGRSSVPLRAGRDATLDALRNEPLERRDARLDALEAATLARNGVGRLAAAYALHD